MFTLNENTHIAMTSTQWLLGGLNLNPLSDQQVLPLEKLSKHGLRDQGLERYKLSATIITVQNFKKFLEDFNIPQRNSQTSVFSEHLNKCFSLTIWEIG